MLSNYLAQYKDCIKWLLLSVFFFFSTLRSLGPASNLLGLACHFAQRHVSSCTRQASCSQLTGFIGDKKSQVFIQYCNCSPSMAEFFMETSNHIQVELSCFKDDYFVILSLNSAIKKQHCTKQAEHRLTGCYCHQCNETCRHYVSLCAGFKC